MKYILDFDRTLFDTDKLIIQFRAADFDLHNLFPEMLDQFQSKQFLYDDVLPFLSSKKPADIFILTALGNTYGKKILEFQTAKVEQEPIRSLVNRVTYVMEDKGQPAADIVSQFPPQESVVFIDDLLKNCLAVKVAVPHVHCFLILRNCLSTAKTVKAAAKAGIEVIYTLTELDGRMRAL